MNAESQDQSPQPPPPAPPPSESEEGTWGMVCHLAGLGTVLVAALVWILVRGRSALADDQGKESVNFQLLIAVIFCALVLASYCIPFLPVIQPLVYLSYVALAGFDLTMIVLGAVRASDGERFRYRVSLRLMR